MEFTILNFRRLIHCYQGKANQCKLCQTCQTVWFPFIFIFFKFLQHISFRTNITSKARPSGMFLFLWAMKSVNFLSALHFSIDLSSMMLWLSNTRLSMDHTSDVMRLVLSPSLYSSGTVTFSPSTSRKQMSMLLVFISHNTSSKLKQGSVLLFVLFRDAPPKNINACCFSLSIF